MKPFKRFLLICIIFSSGVLYAQVNSGLAFLKVDVDARAAAMAGAYTAVANDASASYWNPAALALATENTLTGMYNDWFAGISHSFIATQFMTGDNALALSFNYQNISGIEIRDHETENAAGIVDAFSLAAALSYATNYDDWLVGGSLKYLFEKYYLVSAPGWAIDLGLYKKDLYGGIDFGLVVQNLGKMSELDKEATKLPIIVRTGLAYRIPSFFDDNLVVSPDLQWIENEKTYVKIGLQYYVSDHLVLRGGLKNGNENLLVTGGFGIVYDDIHLDYAYAPFEYELGSSNRFSFGLSF